MKLKILSALNEYAKVKPTRFHMPGHKCEKEFCKVFPSAKTDLTEIEYSGIENAMLIAEKDLSENNGAGYTKILTVGSTVGVLSAVYAVKDLGKKLIIEKASHKSVYNALEISGVEPVILCDKKTDGLNELPTVEKTVKALEENEDAIGVLYTYPDYYGRTFDIEGIYKAVKERNKILIIDGAHGSHFKITDNVYAGKFSDIWIDGAHKTDYTLTQGATVNCTVELKERLKRAIEKFNTTSPNYNLAASVEYGEKYLIEKGKEKTVKVLGYIDNLKKTLKENGIVFLNAEDGFKLSIDTVKSETENSVAIKILEKNKIFCEMNDGRYILFMFSLATDIKDLKKLEKVLLSIPKKAGKKIFAKEIVTVRKMPYLEALKKETEEIELVNACGKITAENLGCFPPCFPLITAGEEINGDIINYLKSKTNTFGINSGKVRVVKDER